MINAVEIEKLLMAEEERCVRYGRQWADRVRELMKYRDDNGHCNVPQRQSSLGIWVNTQRAEFKKFGSAKASHMTTQRIKILNHIGFVWDASDKIGGSKRDDEGWMRMFEQLMEYKEQHGDCLVPNKYEDNPKLGRWVATQRQLYQNTKKGKTTRMTEERIHKLEEIGFVWDASDMGALKKDYEGWLLMFEELMEYKKKHVDCLFPIKQEGNRKLGYWVSRQRQLYRDTKKREMTWMTKERQHKLEAIGFEWKAKRGCS